MSRKRQEVIVPDVTVADAGAEGKAIVRHEGMVVFVPYVVPGDVIDLKIYKKKHNYAEGIALAVKQPSPFRVAAPCRHFGQCGGCKWQPLQYEQQLAFKQKQVRDNLERLGHIDTQGMRPILGSDRIYEYRNKLEYTFSNKRWIAAGEERPDDDPGAAGFHVPTVFDKVLPIEKCLLQPEPSNLIRNAVRDYALEHRFPFYDIRNHTGFLRNLVIRNTDDGQWMVTLIVAEERPEWLFPLLEHLSAQFPQISALLYIINTKLNDSYNDLPVHTFRGEDCIIEQMERYGGGAPLRFKVGPKSFYQTNSLQAHRLYSAVAELARLQGDEVVYDLYTGTGTIAQFVADRCRRVVGIEYVEEAIADARENARINGIVNCEFFAGDMAKVLTDDFVQAQGRPDVVITDPPRSGMHPSVVEQLLRMEPARIVYVSCNPATQARDLAMLTAKYEVGALQPVDMFPHTQHVENVAELTLKQKK